MTHANTPADDLDRHLTRFFRAELPAPFPPAPAVVPTELAVPLGRGCVPGRYALAASVAAIAGLGLWASHGFAPPTPSAPAAATAPTGLLNHAAASGAKVQPKGTAPAAK